MKLKSKVILAQSPLGIILAMMGLLFVLTIFHIGQSSHSILASNFKSILALQKMRQSLDSLDNVVWHLMDGNRNRAILGIKKHKSEFIEQFNVQKSNINVDGEKAATKILDDYWKSYIMKLEGFIVLESDKGAVKQTYMREIQPRYLKLKDAIHHVMILNQDAMYYKNEEVNSLVDNVSYVMVIFAVVAFGLGTMISTYLTGRMMAPLTALTELVRGMGKGKFEARVKVEGNDEVAELGQEFNNMMDRIEEYRSSSLGELIRARLFMQVAIDTLPDPLLIVGRTGNVINVNQQAINILGKPDHENFHDLLDQMPKALGTRIRDIVNHIYQKPKEVIPRDLTKVVAILIKNKNIQFVPIARPVIDPSKGLVAVALVLQNITDVDIQGYIRTEKFSRLTHKLLLPLNSVHTAIHTCLEKVIGDLTQKQAEFLTAARGDCFRLKKMVTSLQDLEKLEDITLESHKERTSISTVINESLEDLEVIATSKDIKFNIELPPVIVDVCGNYDQLKLVFNNVLDNAIHHSSKAGEVKIVLEEKKKNVVCSISNDGNPIPAEHYEKIFDKFFQLPGEKSNRDGLGLYIARNIVEDHGGKISVKSSKKLGTTFKIEFPHYKEMA